MPKPKKLRKYTFFCYICKEHFEFSGEGQKEARKKFHASGHDDGLKRKRLLAGLVGVYETAEQLARKHGNSPSKRAKEKREQDFIHHAATGE